MEAVVPSAESYHRHVAIRLQGLPFSTECGVSPLRRKVDTETDDNYSGIARVRVGARRVLADSGGGLMRVRFAATSVFLTALLLGAGCTERHMVITSEPPGAEVVINQTIETTTPATIRFKHYGVYDIRLSKEGYYPLHVAEPIRAPAHQYTGPDFVSDVLVPVKVTDRHELHYRLEPIAESDDLEAVLDRSMALKEEAAEVARRRRERDEDRWTFRPPFLRERERIRRQREQEEAERARREVAAAEEGVLDVPTPDGTAPEAGAPELPDTDAAPPATE